MKYLIVADSACNIYTYESNEFDFVSVPLTIRVGDDEYVDTDKLNVTELMNAVYSYDGKSGSACPSPECFKSAFDGYDKILIFTITSGLSGSYNSAVVAKEMELEEHPEKEIHIYDSLSAGPSITLMVQYAAKLIEEKLSFEEIVKKLDSNFRTFKLAFILDKLDNFVKNGRINKLVAATVGVLGIRIVGKASLEGTLEVVHKARNFNQAVKKIISDMEENGYKGGKVILAHFEADNVINQVKEAILAKYNNAKVTIMANSGLCSYYAERGGILLGYETEVTI